MDDLEAGLERYDWLTGLLRREPFLDEVARSLADAPPANRMRTALVFNLDQFKVVCEAYGIPPSDGVLVEVAVRLLGAVGAKDVLARIGGDEFAVLLAGGQDDASCRQRAEMLRAELERPQRVSGAQLSVRTSVGYALFDATAPSAESVLNAAREAMLADKRSRKAHAAGLSR
jgi:diguanylate cyclase (GGDEF)-like protein